MNYVLVVTEDKAVALSLKIVLKDNFFVEEAPPVDVFKIIPARRPGIVFLDSQFSEAEGGRLLDRLLELDRTLTVVVMVPSFNRTAEDALEKGAFDILEKPFQAERLMHLLRRAVERDRLNRENEALKQRMPAEERIVREAVETEKESGLLFELLIQAIGSCFPNTELLSLEILKVLRKNFRFGNLALFLKTGEEFTAAASLGMEENLLRDIRVSYEHPIIQWFIKRNCLLNIPYDGDIPQEIRDFAGIMNANLLLPCKTFHGKLLGFLVSGPKLTGQKVTSDELSVLVMVCEYVTMVLENVILYNDAGLQKGFQDAIFENVTSGVVAVDREGRIRILNAFAGKLLGVGQESLIGREVEKLGSQIAGYLRKTLHDGATAMREVFTYAPTKSTFGMSTSCLRTNDEIQGAVGIFQDLTSFMKLEEKEREVERHRYWNTIAARLSHELKNPLVAIKTFAQMLPAKYSDEEFRTTFSTIVQEEVGKLNRIIEKMNKLADSQSLSIGRFDLGELIENLKEHYGTRFSRKNVRFVMNNGSYCPISGDFLRIKEAFEYIFDFCYEDAAPDTTVEAACRIEDLNVVFEIFESGKKFEFKKTDEMFVPFSPHLESTLSIGMVLAKKILEAHNGTLEIDQKTGGKKFVVQLPNRKDEANINS